MEADRKTYREDEGRTDRAHKSRQQRRTDKPKDGDGVTRL